jgi:hypothetical protein
VMSNRRRRLISPIEAAYSRRMRRVEQGCTSRSDDVVVVVSARTASDGCVSRMPCKACRDVKLRGRLPAKLRNGTHPRASKLSAPMASPRSRSSYSVEKTNREPRQPEITWTRFGSKCSLSRLTVGRRSAGRNQHGSIGFNLAFVGRAARLPRRQSCEPSAY